MSKIAISADSMGKRYRIGQRERYRALRDLIADALHAPARLLSWRKATGRCEEHIWALKDISFEIGEGEVVGLIGRNGAGKSTLLKILARITHPTEGHAELRGRVGSLLEVGTGFHPELTGRENIYLSGAVLGMKKAEINRKFDEIVAFSEVDRFLDTPLKHYSSGMQMRLAFSVAAHLDPEILLIDEVLAVGDLQFQKKCLAKMGDVARTGRTIVFVSHQMNQIRRLCERVLWIESGRIKESGATAKVVSRYESAMSSVHRSKERVEGVSDAGGFAGWEIVHPATREPFMLTSLGPITVKFMVRVKTPVERGDHGIALYNHENQLIWAWAVKGFRLEPGEHEFCHTFPMLPVRPGFYSWYVSLYDDGKLIDAMNCIPEMLVATEIHQFPTDEWKSILNLPSEFAIGRERTDATQFAKQFLSHL